MKWGELRGAADRIGRRSASDGERGRPRGGRRSDTRNPVSVSRRTGRISAHCSCYARQETEAALGEGREARALRGTPLGPPLMPEPT